MKPIGKYTKKRVTGNVIQFVLGMLLFVSCEEYYTPDLDNSESMLVCEAMLTNDISKNFVKLSVTKGFYSTDPENVITNAAVDLFESGSNTIVAKQESNGYFTFPKAAIPGKTYTLRIYYENQTYESDPVVMPALPSVDSLYTVHRIDKSYSTDAYGVPFEVENPVRDIRVDVPISEQLKYFRFTWRTVIEWVYLPPMNPMKVVPPYYGWKSRYDNENFNIAGQGNYTGTSNIKNHTVLSLAYDTQQYLDSAKQDYYGWIIMLDEYGITKNSYDFYDALDKQFTADGNLFDPVLAQIPTNLYCKTDKTKKIVGFFNVNSYRQYRYFIRTGSAFGGEVVQRRINRYPDIPDSGYLIGEIPSFWENY